MVTPKRIHTLIERYLLFINNPQVQRLILYTLTTKKDITRKKSIVTLKHTNTNQS
jgi:hypothetical protein